MAWEFGSTCHGITDSISEPAKKSKVNLVSVGIGERFPNDDY